MKQNSKIDEATISLMESAVRSAGALLCAKLQQPGSMPATQKPDRSFVTALDLELNTHLRGLLAGSIPIISEEEPQSHALLSQSGDFWLVDPLDGTSTCRRFRDARDAHVGFGPLLSLLRNGRIEACSFYHVPRRTLYTALRNGGAWCVPVEGINATVPPVTQRIRLQAPAARNLRECIVLFYPGSSGELTLMRHLSQHNLVEDSNNFSGFANHCVRLAHGFEQVQFQFSVGPWDYGAVLFMVEAGLTVVVDPLGARVKFDEWQVVRNNPVLAYPPSLEDEFDKILDAVMRSLSHG